MSETITVESAELRKTKSGDEFLAIRATNGKKYSVWNKALWPLMVLGAMLDVEVETKGQYSNITDAKKSTAKPSEPAPQAAERPSGGWGKDNASIEAQVAVKAVVEALVHQVEVPPDVIAGCWEWCRVRLPRGPMRTENKPAPTRPPAGARPVSDGSEGGLFDEPERPKVFRDWGQMLEAAKKLGVMPSDICVHAGKDAIMDFKGDYEAAWTHVEAIITERKGAA